MDGTDTWGIASADFLRWYLLAAFVAVALVLLSNWLASHRSVPASPTGRVLTPPEVGALTNDTQAVMASLAILRGADVIDSRGRVRRALTDTERTHLDWFTRTVLERLGSGKAPLVRSRLVTNMSVACAQLRSQLIKEGLLHGRSERGASTVRVFPILFVAAVGFVRVISGIANGKPVLFLVGIIVLLLLTLPFVRRRRRRTAQGDAELRRLRVENDYLSPRSRPSFTAYGPSRAGMSAALFGAGALLMLDPAMAGALSYGSAQAGGAASFGFGGDSGGGSSGDGGGSSCGG
ncbi:TIGR04222 domain-containing membrane protein, partial [Rhodococcus sp. 06-412-2C]|uniref:TIGR04222 domain-containing membrane protein n=1 Tax=Rhodococcus sp. 06-412-2C TaxID=2022487 RepID=UPI000B9AF4F3